MNKNLTGALIATTAVSLGLAGPAAAAGPPKGVVGTACDGSTIVLVVRGDATAVLPGACIDGAHNFKLEIDGVIS